MKIKPLALLVVLFLLIANTVEAKSLLLRLKLQKGAVYEMTTDMNNMIDQDVMGQKMKLDQNVSMVMSFNVLDVLPNENFLIEYSLQSMKLMMNMNGHDVLLDSNSPEAEGPLKSLSSLKFKMELNDRGQVKRVEGLGEYAKNLNSNPQLAQSMQMFMDEKGFASFMDQIFNYFPENEVKVGDKWSSAIKMPALMNMDIAMNFEVVDIRKSMASLKVISDVNIDSPIEQEGMKINVKMAGNQNGIMVIDTVDGWLSSSDLTQKFDMKMKMKNPQTGEDMEIPMLMNSVAKITVIKK